MLPNFANGRIDKKNYRKLFRILFTGIAANLILYGLSYFLFLNFWFERIDYTAMVVNLFILTSIVAAGLGLIIGNRHLVSSLKQQLTPLVKPANIKTITAIFLLFAIMVCSCKGKLPLMGVEKDMNTGLVTTYKNMKPGRVLMLMNDEVLNHNDIPLGESFLLVNDQLTGLEVKDGKVSVGASLIITDKAGKILLKEDDLFKGKDVLHKDSVNYLKCTVPTGKPMQWEEKYDIAVTFWDKYGEGKIENKVTIRCIDIP